VKRVEVLDSAHGELSTHRKSLGSMQTVKRKSMSVASFENFSEQAAARKSVLTS